MATGLSDHIWTLCEWLTLLGVQPKRLSPLLVADEDTSPMHLQTKVLIFLREERQEMKEMHFKKSFIVV